MVLPGEIFGEKGIVDSSSRSVTARAVGNVVVEIVDQHGALSSPQNEPDIAFKVKEITKSLANTNQVLVSSASRNLLNEVQIKPDIWSLIGGLIAKRRNKKRFLEIRIASLAGDGDGTHAALLERILGKEAEMRVAILSDELPENNLADENIYLSSMSYFGQQVLGRENADLLIWGEVNQVSMDLSLRFLSRKKDTDQPGGFLITDRFSLPKNFSPEYGRLLFAVVVAATVPRSDAYHLMMRPLLINAIEVAQDVISNPPLELPLADQASIQTCYGNVFAIIGNHLSDSNWYQKAVLAYQGAAESISAETAPVEWANVHYHLGRIQHIIGDKNRDERFLETALESYQAAISFFTRSAYPWEWALLQNRLGGLFYRLDTLNNDTERLKESVTAFQSSLRIITRKVAPLKWSEVKNSLGQALQVWGDTAKNRELLELAVKCCVEALQVRSREETPFLWAATQNNLGSALYLLGRQLEETKPLEYSVEAFGKALTIYQAYGATRLGKVSERNMTRVKNLLKTMRLRRVAKLDWEDEPRVIPPEPKELQQDNNRHLAEALK